MMLIVVRFARRFRASLALGVKMNQVGEGGAKPKRLHFIIVRPQILHQGQVRPLAIC